MTSPLKAGPQPPAVGFLRKETGQGSANHQSQPDRLLSSAGFHLHQETRAPNQKPSTQGLRPEVWAKMQLGGHRGFRPRVSSCSLLTSWPETGRNGEGCQGRGCWPAAESDSDWCLVSTLCHLATLRTQTILTLAEVNSKLYIYLRVVS